MPAGGAFVGSGGIGVVFTPAVPLAASRPLFAERNYTVSGTTVDVNGAPLGGCIVKLFYTATDTVAQQMVSDSAGRYSFAVDKTVAFYTVQYKAGPPDVYGSSLNNLAGS